MKYAGPLAEQEAAGVSGKEHKKMARLLLSVAFALAEYAISQRENRP